MSEINRRHERSRPRKKPPTGTLIKMETKNQGLPYGGPVRKTGYPRVQKGTETMTKPGNSQSEETFETNDESSASRLRQSSPQIPIPHIPANDPPVAFQASSEVTHEDILNSHLHEQKFELPPIVSSNFLPLAVNCSTESSVCSRPPDPPRTISSIPPPPVIPPSSVLRPRLSFSQSIESPLTNSNLPNSNLRTFSSLSFNTPFELQSPPAAATRQEGIVDSHAEPIGNHSLSSSFDLIGPSYAPSSSLSFSSFPVLPFHFSVPPSSSSLVSSSFSFQFPGATNGLRVSSASREISDHNNCSLEPSDSSPAVQTSSSPWNLFGSDEIPTGPQNHPRLASERSPHSGAYSPGITQRLASRDLAHQLRKGVAFTANVAGGAFRIPELKGIPKAPKIPQGAFDLGTAALKVLEDHDASGRAFSPLSDSADLSQHDEETGGCCPKVMRGHKHPFTGKGDLVTNTGTTEQRKLRPGMNHERPPDPLSQQSYGPVTSLNKLSLMTFNAGLLEYRLLGVTWYSNPPFAKRRLQHIAPALRKSCCDVVALQEVYEEWQADYLTESLRITFPFTARRTSGGAFALHNGLMILSKFPILHTSFHPFSAVTALEKMFGSKGILEATVDIPTVGEVTFLNIHLASGAVDPESQAVEDLRNEEIEQVLSVSRAAAARGEVPVIIGDLNAAPNLCPSNYRMFLEKGWRDSFLLAVKGEEEGDPFRELIRLDSMNNANNDRQCYSASRRLVAAKVMQAMERVERVLGLSDETVMKLGLFTRDESNASLQQPQNERSESHTEGNRKTTRNIMDCCKRRRGNTYPEQRPLKRQNRCLRRLNHRRLKRSQNRNSQGRTRSGTSTPGSSCSCTSTGAEDSKSGSHEDTTEENILLSIKSGDLLSDDWKNNKSVSIPVSSITATPDSKSNPTTSDEEYDNHNEKEADRTSENIDESHSSRTSSTNQVDGLYSSPVGSSVASSRRRPPFYRRIKSSVFPTLLSRCKYQRRLKPKRNLCERWTWAGASPGELEPLTIMASNRQDKNESFTRTTLNSSMNETAEPNTIEVDLDQDPFCIDVHTWDPQNPLNSIGPHSECQGQRCDHIFLPPRMISGGLSAFQAVDAAVVFTEPSVTVEGCCCGLVNQGSLVTLSDHYSVKVELRRILPQQEP